MMIMDKRFLLIQINLQLKNRLNKGKIIKRNRLKKIVNKESLKNNRDWRKKKMKEKRI
jgi:hypothetical protein